MNQENHRQPRVSVVMRCYRQARFLPDAVAAMVSQTYGDWEIVVVNDGSPDDTSVVARQLIATYPERRIRLLEQENQGPAGALNSGVAATAGAFILVLDADDGLHPVFLQRAVAALDADPGADIVFTDVVLFGAKAEVWKMGPFDLGTLTKINRLCCTSLYRRHLWEEAGGYALNMELGYEDWDFWVGCAERGHRAVHLKQPLFFYRMHTATETINTTAMRYHRELRAQVILNHPGAFAAEERAAAGRLLAAHPLPGRGGQPVSPAVPSRTPAVTVVIPCYKQAEYLPMALASIARQTFTDWEVVVVDDGSPDDTARVARQVFANLPGRRCRLLEQENAGLAAARNAGIAAARGRYILPLDADDCFEESYLEKAVRLLEADPNVDIVVPDGVTFGTRAGELLIAAPETNWATVHHANCLNYCSLYRREVWEKVGGYNPNMTKGYEDWDFWVGCRAAGLRVGHLTEPVFFYRIREGSMYAGALQFDRQLRARIVLNHPGLYEPQAVEAARALLEREPLPVHAARR